MSKKVVIVEDQEFIAGLLAKYVTAIGMEVAAIAGSLLEAEPAMWTHRPDAVVLDYELPDGCGLELVERMKGRVPTNWILVTANYSLPMIRQAEELDVDGIIIKRGSPEVLAAAIQTVLAGRRFISPEASALLRRGKEGPALALDPQLEEVLYLHAAGLDRQEIGLRLGISDKTVSNRLTECRRILNVRTADDALGKEARRLGLVAYLGPK